MTKEEKAIERLVDILSEANRTGDAVCYITSEDNETIKTAIEALEQHNIDKLINKLENEKFKLYSNDWLCGFDSGLGKAEQVVKEFYEECI